METTSGYVPFMAVQSSHGRLDTSSLYKALMAAHTPHSACSDFVWKNRAPPRVQFFVWLLVQRRVHSRSNLLKKSIVADATCELCRNHHEPVDHLAVACPVAASLWQHVGVDLPLTVDTLHSMATPSSIPAKHNSVFIFLCCWNIWKHRNRVVFDGVAPSLPLLLNSCREDVRLWAWRLPREDMTIAESWCSLLSPM